MTRHVHGASLVALLAVLACGGSTTDPHAIDASALDGSYDVLLTADAGSATTCQLLTVTLTAGVATWGADSCATQPASGAIVNDTLVLREWHHTYATDDSTPVTRYEFTAFTGTSAQAVSRFRGPCDLDAGAGLCTHETGRADWGHR